MNDPVKDLAKFKNDKKARALAGYFKTKRGEYGAGDIFWGIYVPDIRAVAKKYSNLELDDVLKLLSSKVHEQRLAALLILVNRYHESQEPDKKKIFDLYLKNTKYINNWDLVDLSAPNIVGDYLKNQDRKVLSKLAKSKTIWERRIAIISTLSFIKSNDFEETLKIARVLLYDRHDLIHKAVGWMLREVGKQDTKELENFLDKHYRKMPRTTLRYALERINREKRDYYMKKD